MKAAWFKECKTKKEKEAVSQSLHSNREGLDRLKEILEPMLPLLLTMTHPRGHTSKQTVTGSIEQ